MDTALLTNPDLAFLFLVLGALGLLWELHAPGMFVPGVLGVLLFCVGAYGMYRDSPRPYGVAMMAVAVLLLAIEFKYYTHMLSGLAGTMLLAFSATVILGGPNRITPSLAIAVSLAFGVITAFLGFLGVRARQNRLATGPRSLVGEVGVARTEIRPYNQPDNHPDPVEPYGMVFVHGEYWQARSDGAIAPGRRVRVEQVQDMIVIVKEA